MLDRSVWCKVIAIGATVAAISFGGCLASYKLAEVIDAKDGVYTPSDEISDEELTKAAILSTGFAALAVTAGVAYYTPKDSQDDDDDDYDDDDEYEDDE